MEAIASSRLEVYSVSEVVMYRRRGVYRIVAMSFLAKECVEYNGVYEIVAVEFCRASDNE